MTVWTKSELIELLAIWKEAYKAVALGKSYTISGRTLTRQDADTIRAQISRIQADLEALENPRKGTLRSVAVRRVR